MKLLALLAGALLCAPAVAAQVTAVAELRSGVATLSIGNPTPGPLHITVQLFRDATVAGGPVTLGDSVSALISPSTFTLQPGEVQTVRIRVKEPVRLGELLRVVTLLDPQPPEAEPPGARLLVRMRLITKLLAQ
jgi:P pilus assembly chaperone PapD